MQVVVQRKIQERRALHVKDTDRVEADVDAAGQRGNPVGMPSGGRGVQHVQEVERSASACVADFLGHPSQRGGGAAGQKHSRAFLRERACARAADGTAAAMHDHDLVLQ